MLGFPYGLIAAAALLAGVYAAGWWHGSGGKRELEREISTAVEKRRTDIAELVVDLSGRNQALAQQLTLERGRDNRVFVTLKERVPVYVTESADRGCVVPRGFVLHHDAAWGGSELPAAPGGPVDAPSGIPLSRVADANAGNAQACRDLRREVDTWRTWYRDTRARWDAFARATQGQPAEVPQTKGR